MNTITAHCLVKNEARFLWYSVMSVIDYVDQILLWDTGSTDGTLEIVEEIIKRDKEGKVSFREYGEVGVDTFWKARQEMLDQTKTNWFLMVDGDEVWWQDSIERLVKEVNDGGDKIESIIVPTYNLVGDIFHYLPKDAGKYNFLHKKGSLKGHYNLRAVNTKIQGLKSYGEHGTWGWVDQENKMIQDRDRNKILFVDRHYMHATFLERSSDRLLSSNVPKRKKKLKYETGMEFPKDFYYPEVFFRQRPKIVPSVWYKTSKKYKLRAIFETPLKRIKRIVLPDKVGY